jgi:hypothetical protein
VITSLGATTMTFAGIVPGIGVYGNAPYRPILNSNKEKQEQVSSSIVLYCQKRKLGGDFLKVILLVSTSFVGLLQSPI